MTTFRILHVCCVIISVTLSFSCGGVECQAQEAGDNWRRWAIISTNDVDQMGVSDLLFAELAARDNLELVERGELAKVLAEQELQRLGAVGGTAARLEVGQLLAADALLFLGIDNAREGQFLTFWICDCRTGARVTHERVPTRAGFRDEVVKLCLERVDAVRKQYPAGVRGIVAVPPFVSQNLVQDNNHLQTAYARVLQSALMTRAGLAVVEMEEAEAIGRELAVEGATLESNRVPLFIRGRFESKSEGVLLEIEADRAGKEPLSISEVVPSEKVAETLTGKVTDAIVESIDNAPTADISATDLFDRLVQRADTLARFASYWEASSVREAAVLMRPDSVDQRLLIYRDLQEWRRSPLGSPAWWDDVSAEERAVIAAKQVESIRTAGRHLEYLMRNRMLSPREAAMPWFWIVNTFPWRSDQERVVAEELFWTLVPLFESLEHTLRNGRYHDALMQFTDNRFPDTQFVAFGLRSRQDELWLGPSLRYLVRNSIRGRPENLDVRRVVRFFEAAVQTETPSHSLIESFLTTIPKDAVEAWQDINRIQEMFDALSACKHPTHQFYGRCGQLGLKLVQKVRPEDVNDLTAELAALESYVQPFAEAELDDSSNLRTRTPKLFKEIRRKITPEALPELVAKKHLLPENPNPVLPAESRVTFERLPIEGRWLGIRKCNDSLDVLWTGDEVSVIDQTGVLRQLVTLDRRAEVILDVQWDGEYFWLVTDQRIVVLTPDEVVHAELYPAADELAEDKNVIPGVDRIPMWHDPYDAGSLRVRFLRSGLLQSNGSPPLQLQAIAPGRCIACGQYGKYKRVWIADLRLQKSNQKIESKVFHTAIEQGNVANAQTDPSRVIFDPTWHALLKIDGREVLLLGRGQLRGPPGPSLQPLAIDVEALTTSILPVQDNAKVRSERSECEGGFVWIDNANQVLFSQKKGQEAWETIPFSIGTISGQSKYPGFLKQNGRIFSPGPYWHRIDAASRTAELLNEYAVDPQFHFAYFAETAHFGLVGWHLGDMLYKVTISDTPQMQSPYSFVPEELRLKHLNAVKQIEHLGGSVGTRFSSVDVQHASNSGRDWYSVVYLPETWKGGNEALALLRDLYRPGWFIAVKAPISNQGMTHLRGIQTLSSLSLVETQVNDEGTDFLEDCAGLISLRLEGTVNGNEFSDGCIENIQKLKGLKQLTLYGRGFTDVGLQILNRDNMLARLVELYLLDTSAGKGDLTKVCLNLKVDVAPPDSLENLSRFSISANVPTATITPNRSEPEVKPANQRRTIVLATLLLGMTLMLPLLIWRMFKTHR